MQVLPRVRVRVRVQVLVQAQGVQGVMLLMGHRRVQRLAAWMVILLLALPQTCEKVPSHQGRRMQMMGEELLVQLQVVRELHLQLQRPQPQQLPHPHHRLYCSNVFCGVRHQVLLFHLLHARDQAIS